MICSDGGGEFIGTRLVNYRDASQIQRLISEPYHREHNGRAERANRTIIESMRASFRLTKITMARNSEDLLSVSQPNSARGGKVSIGTRPWLLFTS